MKSEINLPFVFEILFFSNLNFSAPSVYAAQELLDFGIVRTFDEPKKLPVNLINTGRNAVQITVSRIFFFNAHVFTSIAFKATTLKDLFCQIQMSRVMRKPTFWFPTSSDTNQAVRLQKIARGLKFRM